MVALHLRAEIRALAEALMALLLPDTSAVLTPHEGWVSLHAEQLSEDLADISELAAPLSARFGEVWASGSLYYRFSAGELQETTHNRPEGLPLEPEDDAAGTLRVSREPEKPGLAEFFGRSQDE